MLCNALPCCTCCALPCRPAMLLQCHACQCCALCWDLVMLLWTLLLAMHKHSGHFPHQAFPLLHCSTVHQPDTSLAIQCPCTSIGRFISQPPRSTPKQVDVEAPNLRALCPVIWLTLRVLLWQPCQVMRAGISVPCLTSVPGANPGGWTAPSTPRLLHRWRYIIPLALR